MSKSVLLSIKPKYCELIASGKKTIEVRKTRPKIDTPFKCYIYMTAGNASYPVKINGVPMMCHNNGGKCIIGEFVCDTIITDRTFGHDPMFKALSCMNDAEIASYCTSNEMYGFHISDLVIYNKPKELREFRKFGVCPCGAKHILHCTENMSFCANRNLTRPPQSWGYVEELK